VNAAELAFTSATDLLGLMRDRALSPVELMRATVARAEALDSQLNAICTPTFETALDGARAAEQRYARGGTLPPLLGLPVTIKDLAFVKGVPCMGGSKIYRDRVPDFDSLHVERLAAAGALSIGKTSVPELGWKGVSTSPVTGVTFNPWRLGYNAGGSSAGAAACAAAGIGPLHQGSDGAGSIRMPAAFCGVFGLKPSFGRVPYFPMPNNGNISHVGPMTRCVADAALMLQVMAGPDDRDPTSLEAPPEDFVGRLDAGVAGLRVAFSPDLGYLRVDPEVAAPVRAAALAFEELGCVVDEADPGWDDPIEMEHTHYTACFAGLLEPYLPRWRGDIDPGLVALVDEGMQVSAAQFVRAQAARAALQDRAYAFFQRYDLLLTPSLSVAAFPVERLIPEHWPQHPWDWLRWAGFSYPFNMTWLPAATCPCGFTSDGLPVGLQIVAARFRDLRVLQAARAFELARPWSQYQPKL
jgi:aspartyl-tRNA(Asn)/glutamyl-tRNA(Gln) amidotransferase subunit A